MLIDFQMPFKNGIEVVKELKLFFSKFEDKLKPPEFVFLTAFVTR
jgi:DNA-binding NarL/FixJ family response regulator